MHRYGLITTAVLLLAVGLLAGLIQVETTPAYAQETEESIPDLSGINIYFSEANGELSRFDRSDNGISRFAGLLRLAGADLFTLEWRKGIPDDADLIVIPGPNSDLTPDMVARLWAYLENGGKVLLLPDAFAANGTVSGALGATGFFGLTWADIGLRAQSNVIVVQGEFEEVDIVQRNNNDEIVFEFSGEVPILSTDFLTQDVNEDHPITSDLMAASGGFSLGDDDSEDAVSSSDRDNLNTLYFDGARAVEIDASLDLGTLTPLVFTDNPEIYGETNFAQYLATGFSEYNIGEDTARGNLILAAAYERASIGSRMVLIGDVDVIRNGTGFTVSPAYSGAFVYPTNARFMLRTVSWLLERPIADIEFPEPGPTATPTMMPTPTPTPTPLPPSPTPTPGAETETGEDE